MTRKINAAGRALIKQFEGLRLEAYRDAVGVLTIGWGHTGDVKPGMKITEHQAEAILDYDLDRFEEAVEKLAPNVNDNQFSALVSFAFNLGIKALTGSTLLTYTKVGDITNAGSEFMRWKYAAGKVLPGLVKRRAAERALFLKAPI